MSTPSPLGFGAPTGISGLGMVTGYGWGREAFWAGLRSGRSAVIDQEKLAVDLDREHYYLSLVEDPEPESRLSLFTRALLAATDEAIVDAKARGWEPGPTVGVVHCAVLGDIRELRDFYLLDGETRSRYQYLKMMPSTPLSMLMQTHGFHGPSMIVSSMCASGNAGLLTAKAWLDAGLASDVIVAATDISATAEHVRQFGDLGVLFADDPALDVCRPFQEGSRGFSGGEASVAMVLTRTDTDRYADLLGGSMSHDAFHVTNLDPSREQVTRTVRDALQSSGVDGRDIAWLNAHGPGTAQCDATEAAVATELLPEARLLSFKPLAGHCQGAASLVEAAGTLLGYDQGLLAVAAPVAPADPRLLTGPTPCEGGLTLKTSIGLGGHNSAVVLAPPA